MNNSIQILQNTSGKILVAFSGGKDSIAMVLFLLELGISKDRIILHHHLVDGKENDLFDWKCTEGYCIAFAKQFGLKLLFSYRKGGIIREVMRNNECKQDVYFQKEPNGIFHIAESNKKAINTRLKFPAVSGSLITRWCSATVKIEVLRTAIAHNEEYQCEIYILTGERREESTNRAKYCAIEVNATNTKKRSATSIRLILDWTEQEVWDIMKRWKVQPHPCYMLGWNRCSCQLCIFGSANIWATINIIEPKKIETISSYEQEIKFTLYNNQTIYDKVNKGVPFLEMDLYWINQSRNFTTPIITNNWVLPKGAFKKESAGAI